MRFYQFGRMICKIFYSVFFPIKVIGQENIPPQGGVLLCPNHISELDPPAVAIAVNRSIHFMAKKELFEIPIFGAMMRAAKSIPVNRGAVNRDTMRRGLKVLKEGSMLCIFPEGTTYKGDLGKGLAGAGFFALRADAVVVPCAIIGPYRLFRKTKIIFGKPVEMSAFRESKSSPDIVVDNIMSEIQQLIVDFK